jgi:hypothetical protein
MASQIEVAQVMAVIGSAYPNFAVTKETVQVYYDLLNDLPVDLLRAATLKCCGEAGRKFAPSVGEIRGASAELMARSGGVPSTLEAWNEVCNAPKSGEYKRLTDEQDENGSWIIEVTPFSWSHPLVGKVAVMLGFPNFPNPENESVDRAHFFKQYEAELQRYSSDTVELPQVTQYIETRRGGKALPMGEAVKQLKG